MPSTHPTTGTGQGTDLAAAGEMSLKAGHTGVDGFTALGTGGSHGRAPPRRCPRTDTHAPLTRGMWGFSGLSAGLGPRKPELWAGWTSRAKVMGFHLRGLQGPRDHR